MSSLSHLTLYIHMTSYVSVVLANGISNYHLV